MVPRFSSDAVLLHHSLLVISGNFVKWKVIRVCKVLVDNSVLFHLLPIDNRSGKSCLQTRLSQGNTLHDVGT